MRIEYTQCDICGAKIEYEQEVRYFKNEYLSENSLIKLHNNLPFNNRVILQGCTCHEIYDNDNPGKIKRKEPYLIDLEMDLCDHCLKHLHCYLEDSRHVK